MDHVVPLSVYRTWETQFLVLACRPCNDAKADSFPLLIAAQLAPGRIAPALWLLLARLSEAALPAEFEVAA
ncbi:HNH endonuclease [Streptomyces lonarensis]|uniref:HNH endonuclease n=1 Tax=Streptomyces lonarensis TaxID=700599 RepID=UPI001FD8301B